MTLTHHKPCACVLFYFTEMIIISDHPAIVSYKKEQTIAVMADLDSEEQYEFRIRAVTRSGDMGPWSEPVIGQSVDRSKRLECSLY